MGSWKEWAGIILLVYLVTAVIYFLVSAASRGVQGAYEAIDTFCPYLSESTRRDFADFLIDILRTK